MNMDTAKRVLAAVVAVLQATNIGVLVSLGNKIAENSDQVWWQLVVALILAALQAVLPRIQQLFGKKTAVPPTTILFLCALAVGVSVSLAGCTFAKRAGNVAKQGITQVRIGVNEAHDWVFGYGDIPDIATCNDVGCTISIPAQTRWVPYHAKTYQPEPAVEK